MTIESLLERIAVALETIADGASDISADSPASSAPVIQTSAQLPTQAPPSTGRGRRRRGAESSAPTPPAQAAAAPATPAASAPAAASASAAPAGGVGGTGPSIQQTTEMILKLANECSREEAIAILKARRGVTRCSDLQPGELAGVYDDAKAAYDRHKTMAATQAGTSLI